MSRIVCLFLLLSTAVAGVREKRIIPVDEPTQQTFEHQSKVAILVGVSAYPEASGLAALKYPTTDVTALAVELEKQGYTVNKMTDSHATRGDVVHALKGLSQMMSANTGTLLFYFSGHGFASQDQTNYLATYGVTEDALAREGLSLSEVEQLMKNTRAKRQILFVDACRNDPEPGKKGSTIRSFGPLNDAEGMRVLYSTKAGSVSYEDDSLNHGVFSYFLLRGLRGDAAGADNLVTFQDLASYVIDEVMDYGLRTGNIQRPYEAGESSGDFLLGKALNPPGPNILAGTKRVNTNDQLTYLWIPAGNFQMGCARSCDSYFEAPARKVTLTRGFWIGQTEVTQAAYERVRHKNPSRFKGPDLPVENVSWEEARLYCEAIGGRLPTEAEWEYAARAGSQESLYGNSRPRYLAPSPIMWDGTNSREKTQPVAQKEPNAWGLYDMLGNVWEWTADWYDKNYYQHAVEEDPTGPETGTERVTRGGGFDSNDHRPTLAMRYPKEPTRYLYDTGFRCAGN